MLQEGDEIDHLLLFHRLEKTFGHNRLIERLLFHHVRNRDHLNIGESRQGDGVTVLRGDISAQGAAILERDYRHSIVLGQYSAGIDEILEQIKEIPAITSIQVGSQGSALAEDHVAGGTGPSEDLLSIRNAGSRDSFRSQF